jgi:tetratricopeptide (TPR) repeat protein
LKKTDTKLYGNYHPDIAKSLFWLGMVSTQQRKFTEAVEYFMRALTVYTHEFGEDHYYVARALTAIGDTFRELGNLVNPPMARPFTLALHLSLPLAVQIRVFSYFKTKESAIEHLNKALAIHQKQEQEHPEAAAAHHSIARVYKLQGNHEAANTHLAIAKSTTQQKNK